MKVRIDEIVIGERHRKDMGDIAKLAESIKTVGLLHPVVVTPDKRLIAGERRIEAVKLLGWVEIETTILYNGQNMPSGGNMFEIEDIGQTCVICGYPFAEIHHALPRQYGGKDTPENLIALCPNHHAAIHFLLKIDLLLADEKRKRDFDKRARSETSTVLAKQSFLYKCDPKAETFYREYVVPMINTQVSHAD